MPKVNELFALPVGPSELCFDKNEFMKKTFSVDDFLHEHRNAAALETIRDDLGIYLKVLRSAMIELINEDYADFVNLSTNLVGLDQSISGIQTPLEQLRDDILNIKLVLNDNMIEIKDCISQKKVLRNYKKNLKSLAKVQNSISKLSDLLENQLNGNEAKPVVLERAALELIQLQFHAKFCKDYLDSAQTEKADSLHKQLLSKMRTYFLNALNSDAESQERCLRIYATLDECEEAEQVFRDDVVGPYMDKKISENTLQNSAQGLVGIYNQILDFISLSMKDLLLLTHHTEKVKGFNFLVNSFWREVERRLESHLASIFAPGNPDSFYLKYKSTLDFLSNIETILGTDQAVKDFHQHPQYKSFQSRWNLPVYFQIRFQEIAGQLEIACDQPITEQTTSKSINKLKCIPLQTALICITKSWSDGIYITQLFPKFWKLTVQIISRITRWIAQTIKEIDKQHSNETKLNKILFLITLYKDGKVLIDNFPNILKIAIEKMPSEIQSHSTLLDRCMQEAGSKLVEQLTCIENVLIKEIVSKSSVNIRQVSDIPRLYRKTNREVPSKHCAYVENMVEPFNSFRKQFHDDIGEEKLQQFFVKSFSRITVQYFKAIEEVLTSVQKTEESLRRLKNLREKTTTTTAGSQSINDRQGMSDDEKIRLQLQVDVRHWTNEIEKSRIQRVDVEKLNEIINLVEDKTKINKVSDK